MFPRKSAARVLATFLVLILATATLALGQNSERVISLNVARQSGRLVYTLDGKPVPRNVHLLDALGRVFSDGSALAIIVTSNVTLQDIHGIEAVAAKIGFTKVRVLEKSGDALHPVTIGPPEPLRLVSESYQPLPTRKSFIHRQIRMSGFTSQIANLYIGTESQLYRNRIAVGRTL